MILAALLLLAFGTMKAQVNEPKPIDPKTDSIMKSRMAELSQMQEQFSEWMHELGMNMQHLSDSIDWKSFERDMEQWGKEMGKEMEQWGKEMEKWGSQFDKSFNYQLLKNDDPQAHSITVEGSGNVTIRQSQDGFSQSRGDMGASDRYVVDGNVFFRGSSDYDVAMSQLDKIVLCSSGDVIGSGVIKGSKLDIVVLGSGDIRLDVDYDTINIKMIGSGDVTLKGQCKMINATLIGSGDLRIPELHYDQSSFTLTGSGEILSDEYKGAISYKYSSERKSGEKRGLLFDAHWNGFEAGLNMLLDPSAMNTYTGPDDLMAIRPMRSWYFGFNIADVGIALNKKHTVGLFTGIGIGWNNYSWKNYIRMTVENNELVNTLLPDDRPVKNSKFGLLYAQVPLMIEVRPTRHFYIDFGVTGGIRLASWTRIKYADGSYEKTYNNYLTNLFKCDASFRIGGENLGFFANYALVPTFVKGRDAAKAHPFMLGFSINF